jgi:DNA-binding MarR family transcriptional regulator
MDKPDASHIELETFWPYQAVVLADQISRYTLGVVKAEAGLNLSQWRVLAAVAEKPGRTARDVTEITPMDKTIVSRAVSSLIKAGHIKKTPDATDKRRLFLTVTPSGQSIYSKIANRLNKTMIEAFSGGMSPDNFTLALKEFGKKMHNISGREV